MSEGFVTASLLFCVGSLAVIGSIQDGLTGDYQTLATKAVLDGFASVALAATLGWGVGLAALSILGVQGTITLGATLFEDVLVDETLAVLTSAGGILVVGIALKLLGVVDVKVGNFLPALVIAPALTVAVLASHQARACGSAGSARAAACGRRRSGSRRAPRSRSPRPPGAATRAPR